MSIPGFSGSAALTARRSATRGHAPAIVVVPTAGTIAPARGPCCDGCDFVCQEFGWEDPICDGCRRHCVDCDLPLETREP